MSCFNVQRVSCNDNELLLNMYPITEATIENIHGFNSNILACKDKLDTIDSDIWKKSRWFVNNYDFKIQTNIINRAFYKYWEMIMTFDVYSGFDPLTDKVYHLAEAPGGFVQATLKHFNRTLVKLPYIVTMSLASHNSKSRIPVYDRRITCNPAVTVTYGIDGTGDITNWINITSNSTKYKVITADGGFDECGRYNQKETLHHTLVLSEVFAAVYTQARGGTFIIKTFDAYTETSMHILFLLNIIYTRMYVYKPQTSRPTNSERYIICKGFRLCEIARVNVIAALDTLKERLTYAKESLPFTIFRTIPTTFSDQIEYINNTLCNTQCKYLNLAYNICIDPTFKYNYSHFYTRSLNIKNMHFLKWTDSIACARHL